MTSSPINRTLYEFGQNCVQRVDYRTATGLSEKAAIQDVASQVGRGVAEVRTAYQFARAVDAIVAVAGTAAQKTILTGSNPQLTVKAVIELRSYPAAQLKVAMQQATLGFHPLGPPPDPELSADLMAWHHDLTRLGKAADLLENVARAITRPGGAPKHDEAAEITLHATAVRTFTDAIRLVLGGGRGRLAERHGYPTHPPALLRTVRKARNLVGTVTGDFLRAAHAGLPSAGVCEELTNTIRRIATTSERVLSVLDCSNSSQAMAPAVETESSGPSSCGGTYVLVFRADAPAIVRLGRLDTFWIPAGYLLYVGSAFGGGGVHSRTTRHITGSGATRWNVDHLRGFARPIELWWTHHSERVECSWAMALAAMSGYCCPAPQGGANDCRQCPAHLFRSATRPSCIKFAQQLGLAGWGGYTIHRRAVTTGLVESNKSRP